LKDIFDWHEWTNNSYIISRLSAIIYLTCIEGTTKYHRLTIVTCMYTAYL